jgi:two-component system nitrogen regulation sensor histidine kinase NtrY
MSLRTRLILLFTTAIAVCVLVVTWTTTVRMRRAFESADEQHTSALIAQFRQQFAARGQEVTAALEGIANRDTVQRLALEAAKPQPDYSAYVEEAGPLASAHQLDFLEIVAPDGTIISSAQWPARFGYKEDWVAAAAGRPDAFLKREELPDGPVLALIAVRTARVADELVYVAGGVRLDRRFLSTLVLPKGMRALLYTNVAPGFSAQSLEDADGPVANAEKLAPLIQKVLASPYDSESVQAIPLQGRQGELLGILLVGSSRRDLLELEGRVRSIAWIVGLIGILAGMVIGIWSAARVTKPIEQLAEAASEVAQGNWNAQVEVAGGGEVAQLA